MKDERNQIQKDLDNHRYELLSKWVMDSMSLYQMGGLTQSEAARDVFANLMIITAKVALAGECDPKATGEALTETIEKMKPEIDKFHREYVEKVVEKFVNAIIKAAEESKS